MRTANIQTALVLRAISLAASLDLRMGFVARSANGDKIHKATVLFNRKKAKRVGHAGIRAHQAMVGPAGRNEGSQIIALPLYDIGGVLLTPSLLLLWPLTKGDER